MALLTVARMLLLSILMVAVAGDDSACVTCNTNDAMGLLQTGVIAEHVSDALAESYGSRDVIGAVAENKEEDLEQDQEEQQERDNESNEDDEEESEDGEDDDEEEEEEDANTDDPESGEGEEEEGHQGKGDGEEDDGSEDANVTMSDGTALRSNEGNDGNQTTALAEVEGDADTEGRRRRRRRRMFHFDHGRRRRTSRYRRYRRAPTSRRRRAPTRRRRAPTRRRRAPTRRRRDPTRRRRWTQPRRRRSTTRRRRAPTRRRRATQARRRRSTTRRRYKGGSSGTAEECLALCRAKNKGGSKGCCQFSTNAKGTGCTWHSGGWIYGSLQDGMQAADCRKTACGNAVQMNRMWKCSKTGVALGKVCYEYDAKYIPLYMKGQGRSVETSARGCQARCAKVSGCAHFSWWRDGGCVLQDSTARRVAVGTVTAGPPTCDTSPTQAPTQAPTQPPKPSTTQAPTQPPKTDLPPPSFKDLIMQLAAKAEAGFAKFASLEEKVDTKFASLEKKVDTKFASLEAKVEIIKALMAKGR